MKDDTKSSIPPRAEIEGPRKVTDLEALDTLELGEQGVDMPVRRPDTLEPVFNDDGTPMTITVASADSDKFQKASRNARNRRNQVAGRRGGNGMPRAEEIDNDSIDLLTAVVIRWNITFGGRKPECTPASVRNLYLKRPWIMRQVDAFIADDANFMKNSARP